MYRITINTIMKMNLILFSQLQHSVPLVDLKTLDLIPLICFFFRFSDVKMKTAAHLSLASSVSVVEGHHRCGQQVECFKTLMKVCMTICFPLQDFSFLPKSSRIPLSFKYLQTSPFPCYQCSNSRSLHCCQLMKV